MPCSKLRRNLYFKKQTMKNNHLVCVSLTFLVSRLKNPGYLKSILIMCRNLSLVEIGIRLLKAAASRVSVDECQVKLVL